MKMLYEKELAPYLDQSEVEVLTYAKRLVGSNNATYYQMANELSYLMRRNLRNKEAVEIARMMYEASPSIDMPEPIPKPVPEPVPPVPLHE